jgi:predicted TIM-barrel fold metal-dependent hydrolase
MDAKLRVEQLDRNNIDFQVVTPQWDFDANLLDDAKARLAYARSVNDNLAIMIEEGKGRLIGVGTVPLEDYENGGRQETERVIKELGFKGMFVSSNIRGRAIDLPEFEPFWAHIVELDIPILIHPIDVASSCRPYEAEFDLMHNFGWPFETELALARIVFSGLMERYPNLKVVGHHLGGGLPFFWGRTSETYNDEKGKVVDLPKPLFDYFSKFYYDTAVGGSAAAIRCACDVFGVNRIVFATDSPFGPGSGEIRLATYPQVVKSVGLSAEDNKKIFEDNPRKLFRL